MAMTASDRAAAQDQFARHEALSAGSGTLRLASTVSSTFEVTTLDDIVDASDGVLSLREAVTLANDQAGTDTITFADSIRGGRINLESDLPDITDDLVIDGDPDDGGPGGIVIDGDSSDDPRAYDAVGNTFSVRDASLAIEDVTLDQSGARLIDATGSDIVATRALIQSSGRDAPHGDVEAIRLDGGSLTIESSTVQDNAGAAVMFTDAGVTIVNSDILRNSGDYTAGVMGTGTLDVVGTTFGDNRGYAAGAIRVEGAVDIADSAFIDNGTRLNSPGGAYGVILVDGELQLVNSTIAGSRTGSLRADTAIGAVVLPAGDSTANIVNVTITGSEDDFDDVPSIGLFVGAGSEATVANSIIDDAVAGAGTIISNGANTFRDAAVDGAVAGDRLGVTADQLFAATETIGDSSVLRGVPGDNGGPTWTVALLNDTGNPAIDAADPSDAPATDQRGIARDAMPDIGAFEAAGSPPPDTLPGLIEGSPLATSLINGVDPAALTLGADADARITFIGENGAFASSLGAYLVDGDGRMLDVQIIFENMQADGPSPAIAPGESMALSDIFDPGDLAEGVQFGLFLVADGANGNLPSLGEGEFAFLDGGDPATTSDAAPALVHIDDSGLETTIEGDVLHIIDAGSPNPLSNKLNPDGHGHAVSGWSEGRFVVGFEDKPWPSGDSQEPDFNDVLIAIDPVSPGGMNGNASLLSAGIVDETGPEQAILDTALDSISASAVAAGDAVTPAAPMDAGFAFAPAVIEPAEQPVA